MCVVAVLLAWVYVSPYFALHSLRQAAAEGNADALREAVDFPAFRASLKEELNGQLAKSAFHDARTDGGPLAAIGTVLAGGFLNAMVDQLVTPHNIAAIVQGTRIEGAHGQMPDILERFSRREEVGEVEVRSMAGYESYSRFAVRLYPPKSGDAVTLVFTRTGLVNWCLSGIRLPDANQSAKTPPPYTTANSGRPAAIGRSEPGALPIPDADIRWSRTPSLIEKYGTYTFDVFRNNPAILERVKALRPGFTPDDVYVSPPSAIAATADARQYFVMSGCRRHACPDYSAVFALNTESGDLFMCERIDEERQSFFGDPDETVQRLLQYFLEHSSDIPR